MTWEIRDGGQGPASAIRVAFFGVDDGALMRTGTGACPYDSSVHRFATSSIRATAIATASPPPMHNAAMPTRLRLRLSA